MKDMDKIFRSKLYEHESALPTDLWAKIENGIAKKKRRGFIWFLFGGIGLFGILSATIYYNGFNPTPIAEFAENMDKISTFDDNQNLNVPLANIDIENNSDKDESIITESPIPESKKLNKSVKSAVTKEKEILAVRPLEIEPEINIIQDDQKIKIDIPSLNINYPDLLAISERAFKDPVGCPSFSKRNRANLFVEAYFQPLYAYSLITSNSPEVGDQYLNLRKDSENSLFSWSAGVNVGWLSDYNVGVKAGAEYEVINERFTYEDPEAIRNQTVITIDTIFNGDGTFNVSMDTSIVQVSGSELQKIHNFHKTLSIPIHAIYQMNFGNLAVELSGGPIFNVQYKNRGKIVDPSNMDQWFTNGESGSYEVYKTRLSVSFSLSVSALYSVNESIQLFARPTFKYSPGTMSVSTSPFNQTYMNTGLSLGARYYFSGNPNY